MTKPPSDVFDKLEQLRAQLFERVIIGFSVLALLILPAGLGRMVISGFHFVYLHNILISLAALTAFFLRKRVHYRYLLTIMLYILVSASISGPIWFGIIGQSSTYALLAAFFITMKWGSRAGLAAIVLYGAFIAFIWFGFTTNSLPYVIPPAEYVRMPLPWVGNLIGFLIVGITMLMAIYQYHESFRAFAETIQRQNLTIEHLANHDALTDLPTLRLANEQLDSALALAKRNGYRVALLFLDLDGFKAVNDTHGHDAGDAVLKAVADRIRATIRTSDTACRVGGDEFLAILSKTEDAAAVAMVCNRLIRNIAAPVRYGDKRLLVGVSIGAALYPDHAGDRQGLRGKADEVMYSVKKSGKNSFRIADA